LCRRQGAEKYIFRVENCDKVRLKRGFCSQHGGKYYCKNENCEKTLMRGMYCLERGGQKPTCRFENCEKWTVRNGVLQSSSSRCSIAGVAKLPGPTNRIPNLHMAESHKTLHHFTHAFSSANTPILQKD
jgi:hypothetical protein